MKIILTVQLQQDAGTPVITGSQTKLNFIGDDIDVVKGFLGSVQLANLVRLMAWYADGQLAVPTPAPTVTISNLK